MRLKSRKKINDVNISRKKMCKFGIFRRIDSEILFHNVYFYKKTLHFAANCHFSRQRSVFSMCIKQMWELHYSKRWQSNKKCFAPCSFFFLLSFFLFYQLTATSNYTLARLLRVQFVFIRRWNSYLDSLQGFIWLIFSRISYVWHENLVNLTKVQMNLLMNRKNGWTS